MVGFVINYSLLRKKYVGKKLQLLLNMNNLYKFNMATVKVR